jgi:cyanophycinase
MPAWKPRKHDAFGSSHRCSADQAREGTATRGTSEGGFSICSHTDHGSGSTRTNALALLLRAPVLFKLLATSNLQSRIMRRTVLCAALAFSFGCASTFGSAGQQSTVAEAPAGQPRGSLVIVGGGPQGEEITERFIALAGGRARARILVLPMASDLPQTGPESVAEWRKHGVSAWSANLTRADAMNPATARGLDSATGIWFPGGDQNDLMAVLDGTPTAAAIRARYAAGAVVGGTSAGAAVMSTPMITGAERAPGGVRRDTSESFITIARQNLVVSNGLGLVDNAIVDQHFLRRKRANRLISVVLEHPSMLGIGVDESTALVIEPGKPWSVIGESAAIVYDARHATISSPSAPVLGAVDVRMHILPAGSTYDPRTGEGRLP